MPKKQSDIKLIYNPFAGKKRRMLGGMGTSLEDIRHLFKKYQLDVDYFPITKKKQALKFAEEGKKEKYTTVIVAGGDGTVNEVANGLVNSKITLGILPLGTFMNIGKMLSIKNDLETAVMLIKLGRTRKIDVGSVTKINDEKLSDPFYFLETAGVGLDAELQELFKEIEDGRYLSIFKLVKAIFTFYSEPVKMELDGKERTIRSTLITISNGPYTGAALNMAPTARLNDHKLTISLYRMSKFELVKYFINIKRGVLKNQKKIEIVQVDSVKISSANPRLVHADALLFGYTPVVFKIVPDALTVLCGFPNPDETPSLEPRTPLDP